MARRTSRAVNCDGASTAAALRSERTVANTRQRLCVRERAAAQFVVPPRQVVRGRDRRARRAQRQRGDRAVQQVARSVRNSVGSCSWRRKAPRGAASVRTFGIAGSAAPWAAAARSRHRRVRRRP
jgi:hypothetical protein